MVQSASRNDQSDILSASQSELREKILQQLLDPTMLRTIADIITISMQDKTVSGNLHIFYSYVILMFYDVILGWKYDIFLGFFEMFCVYNERLF